MGHRLGPQSYDPLYHPLIIIFPIMESRGTFFQHVTVDPIMESGGAGTMLLQPYSATSVAFHVHIHHFQQALPSPMASLIPAD
jgi:hypothetical protein